MEMGRLKPFACQWEMSGRCSDPHIFVHHPPNALPPSTLGRLLKNATPADPLSSRAQNPLSWPALALGTWLWPTQPINWSADQLTPIPPTQLTAIRKSEKLIQFFVASKNVLSFAWILPLHFLHFSLLSSHIRPTPPVSSGWQFFCQLCAAPNTTTINLFESWSNWPNQWWRKQSASANCSATDHLLSLPKSLSTLQMDLSLEYSK